MREAIANAKMKRSNLRSKPFGATELFVFAIAKNLSETISIGNKEAQDLSIQDLNKKPAH